MEILRVGLIDKASPIGGEDISLNLVLSTISRYGKVGNPLALGARDRWFESSYLD